MLRKNLIIGMFATCLSTAAFCGEYFSPCTWWNYDYDLSGYVCRSTSIGKTFLTTDDLLETQMENDRLQQKVDDLENRIATLEALVRSFSEQD